MLQLQGLLAMEYCTSSILSPACLRVHGSSQLVLVCFVDLEKAFEASVSLVGSGDFC